ncbi:hypothetical protein GH742_11000 [Legionella sp. MW5194]|uniref:Kdo hydroxylase family protein n=1 Tax=Legionella sp. MW5194 TaxID=2662448 RepID=UPI00193E5167|nr:Kdo hydroxylase family protein [Legionella sp. MW5194]QRN05155.1 hypothetical protein GH742_11000 [Legionella sp. MW5194]
MVKPIFTVENPDLNQSDASTLAQALSALESGQVVFLPRCFYSSNEGLEQDLLSDTILDSKHKNVSFNYKTQALGAFNQQHINPDLSDRLTAFMRGYALFARELIETLFPSYRTHLLWGRTSYRPAEIEGRVYSKRKDDTRLHVDSFSASPVYGQRILRVFCNINPAGLPRLWHLGEPFPAVMARFSPRIPNYNYLIALILKGVKTTKTLRSAYDHYQLQLHDRMKRDDQYQQSVKKIRFDFPALSTWVVFTDQVSHAALSGQYLLEQTFYLPVSAMAKPELSPLKQWEAEKKRPLV